MNFWGRVSINHNVQFQKISMATSCKVTANSEGVGWEMGLKTQYLEGWGEGAKLEKTFHGVGVDISWNNTIRHFYENCTVSIIPIYPYAD